MSYYEKCDMNSETRLRVNENGRVVIPASFRKALGINVGDEIVLRIEDDELRITTLKRRIELIHLRFRDHAHYFIGELPADSGRDLREFLERSHAIEAGH